MPTTIPRLNPNFSLAQGHYGLTLAYRGRWHAAAKRGGHTALQELRRVQSNVSLDWTAKQMPIKDEAERAHYLEGFRRAGLD